jgi:hypothetical protein
MVLFRIEADIRFEFTRRWFTEVEICTAMEKIHFSHRVLCTSHTLFDLGVNVLQIKSIAKQIAL